MNHTEDDTFDALRRIPLHELNKNLEVYSVWFEDHRVSYHYATAENKRIAFKNKLRRLFRMQEIPLFDVSTWSIEVMIDVCTALEGTGWTLDSYTAEVDKPILKKRKEVQTIKRGRRAYFIIGAIISLAIGIPIGLVASASLTVGVAMSASLFYVVMLSAIPVFNCVWPWPYSYWWQYE